MKDEANRGTFMQSVQRVRDRMPILIIPATANQYTATKEMLVTLHSPIPARGDAS